MKILNKKVKFLSKSNVQQILHEKPKSNNENQETIKMTVLEYCLNSQYSKSEDLIIEKLKFYELTEFEIYQLIDLKPKSLLCLQLVIEEMEERFDENKLNSILEIFN
ncbi:hypothetical protein GVAV_001238 [Gurleya vavrai]